MKNLFKRILTAIKYTVMLFVFLVLTLTLYDFYRANGPEEAKWRANTLQAINLDLKKEFDVNVTGFKTRLSPRGERQVHVTVRFPFAYDEQKDKELSYKIASRLENTLPLYELGGTEQVFINLEDRASNQIDMYWYDLIK